MVAIYWIQVFLIKLLFRKITQFRAMHTNSHFLNMKSPLCMYKLGLRFLIFVLVSLYLICPLHQLAWLNHCGNAWVHGSSVGFISEPWYQFWPDSSTGVCAVICRLGCTVLYSLTGLYASGCSAGWKHSDQARSGGCLYKSQQGKPVHLRLIPQGKIGQALEVQLWEQKKLVHVAYPGDKQPQ